MVIVHYHLLHHLIHLIIVVPLPPSRCARMSPRLQALARSFSGVPLVAAVLNHWIYVHLAFMIELCSEFVRAHQVRLYIEVVGSHI